MSVIIYLDLPKGTLKKQQQELLSYGAALANQLQTTANAIVCGNPDYPLNTIGQYGIKEVIHFPQVNPLETDTVTLSKLIQEQCTHLGATVLVFASTLAGNTLAPILTAKMNAGLVKGALGLPDLTTGFTLKKAVFAAKAFAAINITSPFKIIVLQNNSFAVNEGLGEAAVVRNDIQLPHARIQLKALEKPTTAIALGDAALVVSGGRGMKGPENWGLIEELAQALGAATACSRPVADEHWRPHHEHVGQTGGTIAPNLYLAVGISGAIQHLAGVNRSKVIVVINKDPDAPFFKAADYGIVGDAFEILPQLTDAVKKLKA